MKCTVAKIVIDITPPIFRSLLAKQVFQGF